MHHQCMIPAIAWLQHPVSVLVCYLVSYSPEDGVNYSDGGLFLIPTIFLAFALGFCFICFSCVQVPAAIYYRFRIFLLGASDNFFVSSSIDSITWDKFQTVSHGRSSSFSVTWLETPLFISRLLFPFAQSFGVLFCTLSTFKKEKIVLRPQYLLTDAMIDIPLWPMSIIPSTLSFSTLGSSHYWTAVRLTVRGLTLVAITLIRHPALSHGGRHLSKWILPCVRVCHNPPASCHPARTQVYYQSTFLTYCFMLVSFHFANIKIKQ